MWEFKCYEASKLQNKNQISFFFLTIFSNLKTLRI